MSQEILLLSNPKGHETGTGKTTYTPYRTGSYYLFGPKHDTTATSIAQAG
jgi:hypothetical protein